MKAAELISSRWCFAILTVLARWCFAIVTVLVIFTAMAGAQELRITTPSPLPRGMVGRDYSQQLAATGGVQPYRWIVQVESPIGASVFDAGLPPGLVLSSSGVISGRPTASGTFNFVVVVRDSSDVELFQSDSKSFAITIDPALVITTQSPLPPGVVGSGYFQVLSAEGGVLPYTWVQTGGSLPPGLILDSSGSSGPIRGVPTSSGNFNFTLQVRDAFGRTAIKAFDITIALPLTITTVSPLPNGMMGRDYRQPLAAIGGKPPYMWDIDPEDRPLPSGLSLSSGGVISGTPTSSGLFSFTVEVIDGQQYASKRFDITIDPPLTITTSSPLPVGVSGTSYSQPLTASGGVPPYTWVRTLGSLPPGLVLNSSGPSSGLIGGMPTSSGGFNFTAQVRDALGRTTVKAFDVTINPPLTITTASPLRVGVVATPYLESLVVSGGEPAYVWVRTAGSLPPGLNLNSSGDSGSDVEISGTPTSSGNFNFTVMVTDSGGRTAVKAFDVTIVNPPTITTTSPLPSGVVNAPYSQTLTASEGTRPYTWVRYAGTLPPGLNLTSSGDSSALISGTPTSLGNFNFTVMVTDTGGRTAVKTFDITIINPLTITTASPLHIGIVATPYSQSFAASGGTLPYTWVQTAGSLPPGLVFTSSGDSSALISGTPTSSGDFNFTAQVTDSGGKTAVKAFDVTINPPLAITTSSPLPVGTAGTPYSQSLTASGGTRPYTWTRTAGLLPPGLIFTSSGDSSALISGTPTSSGNFNFTAQVTDSGERTAVKTFDVTIILPLTITTDSPLPNGTEGTTFSHALAASGGTQPYSWSVTGLPSGLSLNPTSGVISGAPSSGSFSFTVRVTDSSEKTATKLFDIVINPPSLTITTSSTLSTGTVGTSYSQYLAATGGTPPLTWAGGAGSLPTGLGLDPSGLISGTPSSPGSFAFTAQVTDNAQRTARKTFDITINPAPLTITTSSSLPTGMIGTAYPEQQFAATGGTPPYTWARGAGALPAGLDLNSSGLITGTPASPGNFNFTVQVTDSAQRTVSKVFDISIDPLQLTITAASLPTGEMRTAYPQQQLAAIGGTPPYTWMSLGSLPDGLSLDSSGLIGGTPTISGNFTFTAQVTDTAQRTAIRDFQVAINPPRLPSIRITDIPDSADSLDQSRGNIALSNPYSSAIRARIALTFTPDGILPDDPKIGFLVDRQVIGRVIDIVLPAQTTTDPRGFDFQAGTVAGTIQISVTSVTVESSGTDITPSPPPSHTVVVSRRAPVIESVTIGARTASSFEVVIQGYSNIRAVTQGIFRFTGTTGSNLQTELIPIDLNNDFSTWYTNPASLPSGGQFRSVTTFTVQGDINALSSVSVTLTNAQGTSQARSVNF